MNFIKSIQFHIPDWKVCKLRACDSKFACRSAYFSQYKMSTQGVFSIESSLFDNLVAKTPNKNF